MDKTIAPLIVAEESRSLRRIQEDVSKRVDNARERRSACS